MINLSLIYIYLTAKSPNYLAAYTKAEANSLIRISYYWWIVINEQMLYLSSLFFLKSDARVKYGHIEQAQKGFILNYNRD